MNNTKSRLPLLVGLWLLCSLTVVRAGAPRVAILAAGDKKADAIVALAEAELSPRDDVEVLDREHINKILAEHNFAVRGELSNDESLRLGRLLGCDIIFDVQVLVSISDGGRTETLDVLALDARTGARLADMSLDGSLPIKEEVNAVVSSLSFALDKMVNARSGKGRTVSMGGAREVGLPVSLRHIPNMLHEILERYLLLSPDVTILDRARLDLISREADIAEDTRAYLLPSAVVIDLDAELMQAGMLSIRAALNSIDGGEIGSAIVTGDSASHVAMMMELARKIAEALAVLEIKVAPDMLSKEADHYLAQSRARTFAADDVNVLDIANALAEGALAQDRNNPTNQYRVIRIQYGLLTGYANYNANARKWPHIEEIPTALFLSKLERCVDLLELGVKDVLPREPRGTLPIAGLVSGVMRLTVPQVPSGPQDVMRLKDARRRILAWHRKTRSQNENVINEKLLVAGSEDANQFLSEAISLSEELGVKLRPLEAFSLGHMMTLKAILRGRSNYHNGVAPYQTFPEEGLSAVNKTKLMALYESWAEDSGVDRVTAMTFHFTCIAWAGINREVFKNYDAITRSHIEAARDLVMADNGLVERFGGFIASTAADDLIPPAMLVQVMREILTEMRKNKRACPALLVHLDGYDSEGADYPGMYLDESISQLEDSQWTASDLLIKGSYGLPGQDARKACVTSLKETKIARYGASSELAAKAKIQLDFENTDAKHVIVAAAVLEGSVYMAVADGNSKGIGLLRYDLSSGTVVPLSKIVDWGMVGNSGMEIGKQNVYLHTKTGLLVFPLNGGEGWILDERSGLPANDMGACCEVGDRLYIFCARPEGNTTARRDSYFVKCAIDGSNAEILASSTRRERRSALDNVNKFSISSILDDHKNNRVLFSITGHRDLDHGGIWACDYDTGAIERLPITAPLPFLLGKNAADEFVVQWYDGREWSAWQPGGDMRPLMSTLIDQPPRFMGPTMADFPPGFPLFGDILVRPWTLAELTKNDILYETELPKLDQHAPFFVARYKDKLIACTYTGLYCIDEENLRTVIKGKGAGEADDAMLARRKLF